MRQAGIEPAWHDGVAIRGPAIDSRLRLPSSATAARHKITPSLVLRARAAFRFPPLRPFPRRAYPSPCHIIGTEAPRSGFLLNTTAACADGGSLPESPANRQDVVSCGFLPCVMV